MAAHSLEVSVPLHDANQAGGINAHRCTLILVEGNSAMSTIMAALSVVGGEFHGVMPIMGLPINVRKCTADRAIKNKKLQDIMLVLGVEVGKEYLLEDDRKKLRYGSVMITTDPDCDGSFFKGLIINIFHFYWPHLIKQNFLSSFNTPCVKVTLPSQEDILFFHLEEWEEWQKATPNAHKYKTKRFKGLGSATTEEFSNFFSNMALYRVYLIWHAEEDDDAMDLAFAPGRHEERRELTLQHWKSAKFMRLLHIPATQPPCTRMTLSAFVKREIVPYWLQASLRQMPQSVDGLNATVRKVLFAIMQKHVNELVKIETLTSTTVQHTTYDCSATNLHSVIQHIMRSFVGSNNINLLESHSQSGSRRCHGNDAAAGRYGMTRLSPIARAIFVEVDDDLLRYEFDGGKAMEPLQYWPVIPMLLVNGGHALSVCAKVYFPNHNPTDVIQNIRALIYGQEPAAMDPWYRKFQGTIVKDATKNTQYICCGNIQLLPQNDMIEITELPINQSTDEYSHKVLDFLVVHNVVKRYEAYHTETTVRFVVELLPGERERLIRSKKLHFVFRLTSAISTSNMCAFNSDATMVKFDTSVDVLRNFFQPRHAMYDKRLKYLESLLKAEISHLETKMRFVKDILSKKLDLTNLSKQETIWKLDRCHYSYDPLLTPEFDGRNRVQQVAPTIPPPNERRPKYKKEFDYLLDMLPVCAKTESDVRKELLKKSCELTTLHGKTADILWLEDLAKVEAMWERIKEEDRSAEAVALTRAAAVTAVDAIWGGCSPHPQGIKVVYEHNTTT